MRSKWVPWLVLGLVLLLTGAATYHANASALAKDHARFQNEARHIHDAIEGRFQNYVAILRSAVAFFAGSREVTADEFEAYVDYLRLEEFNSGVRVIGFCHRAVGADSDLLVKSMQAQGHIDYKIHPPGERAEYYPVVYLAPLDPRHLTVFGYDLFSEPVRRATIERARDTGAPAATGLVTLIHQTDPARQSGILIFVPVYRGGVIPATLAERRAAIVGCVCSPFLADELLTGLFGEEDRPRLDFRLFDSDAMDGAGLLYDSRRAGAGAAPPPLVAATLPLRAVGHDWGLRLATPPEFEAASTGNLTLLVLICGLLASALLFSVTRAQALAREAAERRTDEAGPDAPRRPSARARSGTAGSSRTRPRRSGGSSSSEACGPTCPRTSRSPSSTSTATSPSATRAWPGCTDSSAPAT